KLNDIKLKNFRRISEEDEIDTDKKEPIRLWNMGYEMDEITGKNLDKYLGNITIEMIKIGKEIEELKDQYKNEVNRTLFK
ncbi:15033_t:CDS:2, partial [Rhizophagus irregularis]